MPWHCPVNSNTDHSLAVCLLSQCASQELKGIMRDTPPHSVKWTPALMQRE